MIDWLIDIIMYRQDCSMRSLKKITRHICIYIFHPYNVSFTFISKISISLGVRPLDTLLSLHPWTPLGDFRPPGYLLLCVNPSPKVTEPLTPLVLRHCLCTLSGPTMWQRVFFSFQWRHCTPCMLSATWVWWHQVCCHEKNIQTVSDSNSHWVWVVDLLCLKMMCGADWQNKRKPMGWKRSWSGCVRWRKTNTTNCLHVHVLMSTAFAFTSTNNVSKSTPWNNVTSCTARSKQPDRINNCKTGRISLET